MSRGDDCLPADRLKALIDEGSSVFVNPDTKAIHYIRSGRELLRMANNYMEDGLLDSALVLYTRYLTIFLQRLRAHPGFKEVSPADRKLIQTNCSKILPKAEALRATLLKRFQEEYDAHQANLAKAAAAAAAKKEESLSRPVNQNDSRTDDAPWENPFRHYNNVTPTAPPIVSPSSPSNSSAYTDMMADLRIEQSVPGSGVTVSPQSSQSHPGFDRTTKPNRFLSPMNSGLREVVIPGDLIATFLRCADKNTENNVETCGFLTGRILQGRLVITDLIIPKQDGTSDSCLAKGDEEYIMVQDRLDLITFGWIHTHPSQTAFLSSVDMHSQFCYQQMMPEAIAIVCSPRKNQVGTFTLSPEGMEMIGSCPHTSGFHTHPHTSVPLFIDAVHHIFDKSRQVSVHDLRYT